MGASTFPTYKVTHETLALSAIRSYNHTCSFSLEVMGFDISLRTRRYLHCQRWYTKAHPNTFPCMCLMLDDRRCHCHYCGRVDAALLGQGPDFDMFRTSERVVYLMSTLKTCQTKIQLVRPVSFLDMVSTPFPTRTRRRNTAAHLCGRGLPNCYGRHAHYRETPTWRPNCFPPFCPDNCSRTLLWTSLPGPKFQELSGCVQTGT